MCVSGIAKTVAVVIGLGSFAVLLLAAIFWQELAVHLELHRMMSDPAHIEDVFMELRNNYGGSVPLGPGDGVPLPSIGTESIALRRLIADATGAQAVKGVLLREAGEKGAECFLHHERMGLAIVKIRYGLVVGTGAYGKARAARFPRAGYQSGGCVIGEASEALVLSCASCYAAEQDWELAPH